MHWNVANDVINVSLFAYDEITLKTKNFNKRKQDISSCFVRASSHFADVRQHSMSEYRPSRSMGGDLSRHAVP